MTTRKTARDVAPITPAEINDLGRRAEETGQGALAGILLGLAGVMLEGRENEMVVRLMPFFKRCVRDIDERIGPDEVL
jgi:hypothetical protein